jgi:hypothetical protein
LDLPKRMKETQTDSIEYTGKYTSISEQAEPAKPGMHGFRPAAERWWFVECHADAVAAVRREEEVGRNAVGGERLVVESGVLSGYGIVGLTVEEKSRRDSGRYADMGRDGVEEVWCWVGSEEIEGGSDVRERPFERDDGVGKDGEGRVERRIRSGAYQRREMASGGEAHDADSCGVERESWGVGMEILEGVECVEQGHGVSVQGSVPVLNDERGDAATLPPLGSLVAFMVEGEFFIAAAGANEDARAGGNRCEVRDQIGRGKGQLGIHM